MMKKILLPAWLLLTIQGATQETYKAYSRLDYYTDEPAAEMVVEVPAGRKDKKMSFDLVFGQQILLRSFPGMPARSNTIPFPTNKLQKGINEITVSFYEDEQWIDSRKVPVVIREKQWGEVKTDRLTGAMISHGVPMLPLIADAPDAEWDGDLLLEMRSNGFNTVITRWEITRKNPRQRLRWFDRCAEHDLSVIYDLGEFLRRDLPPEKVIGKLLQEIRNMKDHPALLAWLLPSHDLVPGNWQALARAIKETDPYHPVVVAPGQRNPGISYLEEADIILIAPFKGVENLHEAAGLCLSLFDRFGYEKPVWINLDGLAADLEDGSPTAFLASVALCSGASGMITGAFRKANWPLRVNEILPQRLAGNPVRVSTLDEDIIAAGWSGRGGMALVACNPDTAPVEISLRAEGMEGSLPLEILSGYEMKMTDNGTIHASLDAYEAGYFRVVQREDIHFRDPRRKANLLADPGFEKAESQGATLSHCLPVNALCMRETRLVREGAHSLDLLVTGNQSPLTCSFQLKEPLRDTTYVLSVWARLKPSAANFHLKKGWFGKRSWSERKPEPQYFYMGISAENSSFEFSTDWKKYEILLDQGTEIMPRLMIPSEGSYLFDDAMLIPAGSLPQHELHEK